MRYIKKKYLFIGVSFILVAVIGLMFYITDTENDISVIHELNKVLWKIFATVGSIVFLIGAFKKAN